MLRRLFKSSTNRFYSDRPNPWNMDKLTDIGSRKIFNEDHDIIRETLRKFFKSVTNAEKEKLVGLKSF
jgi:long-chain-acyl-CoA dehydrogenase